MVAALNRLQEVDVAYRELAVFDPQAPPTGVFPAEDQAYLDDSPLGIGARWAWAKVAPKAEKVKVVDLEQGWNLGHKVLAKKISPPLYGGSRTEDEPGSGEHGTAVLGEMAATLDLEGAASTAADFGLASHYKSVGQAKKEDYPFPGTNGHVAAAVVNCLITPDTSPSFGPLERGDVLLLEVQRGRFPTEIDAADFDAVRLASALGVIVVEAAGNGNYDLDQIREPVDGRTFRRGDSRFGDSGAIFVGAAYSALPHDRAPFSNFGSRVDCFAWGEGVTTAGFGDLGGEGVDEYLSNTFNGTSSAAPIIAGAAALVQSLHLAHSQNRLRPRPMRSLLSDPRSGVRQGANVGGHIGVMPDLRRVVGGQLNLVPELYLRKSTADDGGGTGPRDAVSSSPDILVWNGALPVKQNAQGSFGSDSPLAHHPAPGTPLQPGANRKIYVRARNRGGGSEKPTAHLFMSPVATLITPELWEPIAPPSLPSFPAAIEQGDTLAVADGVAWTTKSSGFPIFPKALANAGWPQPAELHSLLAAIPWDGLEPGWPLLPPGPPYFSWSAYRAFLRRREVAWRNVHRVAPAGAVTFGFYLGGTPDRDRHFDFEIVQRLPRDAAVQLATGTAMAAKLHQRQPWLDRKGDVITLPQRRSTRFSQVRLPARCYAPAWLHVDTQSAALAAGHSLAIRQLWRGEEVGRITWYFA